MSRMAIPGDKTSLTLCPELGHGLSGVCCRSPSPQVGLHDVVLVCRGPRGAAYLPAGRLDPARGPATAGRLDVLCCCRPGLPGPGRESHLYDLVPMCLDMGMRILPSARLREQTPRLDARVCSQLTLPTVLAGQQAPSAPCPARAPGEPALSPVLQPRPHPAGPRGCGPGTLCSQAHP